MSDTDRQFLLALREERDRYRKALEEIARIDAKDYAMFGPRVALVAVRVAKKAIREAGASKARYRKS
jgi:hypothetical protein